MKEARNKVRFGQVGKAIKSFKIATFLRFLTAERGVT
jgi:hypothetical protein